MKQPEDTKTAELPGLRRRGRPSTGTAMTNAERQRAYRQRLAAQRYETDPGELSRVTLIDQLAAALRAIDSQDEFAEGAERVAEDLLSEIVTRYGLNPKRVKSSRVTK